MMKRILPKANNIILFSLACLYLGSCYKAAENFIQQEISSPGNNYKAIVFSREAGATTGFNTQVSIVEENKELPNKPGNVFIADKIDNVKLFWESEKELHIILPDKDIRIYRKKELLGNIKIVYQYIK